MNDNRITKLNQAKSRLGAAIKRFRQATDLIDEFLKEVLPEREKPDWDDVPGFVQRVKEEAAIIAHAKELRDMLRDVVDLAEPILLEFEREAQAAGFCNRPVYPARFRFESAVDKAATLLTKIDGQ